MKSSTKNILMVIFAGGAVVVSILTYMAIKKNADNASADVSDVKEHVDKLFGKISKPGPEIDDE